MNQVWLRLRPTISRSVRLAHISYLEAQSEHQGTLLGIAWIPLSTLIFSALLGLVFRTPAYGDHLQFFLYVMAGYVSWQFISSSISSSVEIIQKKLEFAVHSGLSLIGLFSKLLVDRLFELTLNLLLLTITVAIVSPANYDFQIILLLPLLFLMGTTSMSVSYLVNLLTLAVPDLANLVKTGIRLMFFATPIFWSVADSSGFRVTLERYNPAAYYLNMMRQCFGIDPLKWHVWAVGACIGLITCCIGYIAFLRTRSLVRNMK